MNLLGHAAVFGPGVVQALQLEGVLAALLNALL
jgi:hypothetical protein